MPLNDAAFDDLLDHARSSRWRGELPTATHRVRQRNPACGDEVSLALQLREGTIQDIRFQGKGCFVSQAAASMLCERVLGQSIERLQHVTLPDLLGFDPMQISMNRQRCCTLGVDALRGLLQQCNSPARETGNMFSSEIHSPT